MDDEVRAELAELTRAARAWLELAGEAGTTGLFPEGRRVRAASPITAESPTTAESSPVDAPATLRSPVSEPAPIDPAEVAGGHAPLPPFVSPPTSGATSSWVGGTLPTAGTLARPAAPIAPPPPVAPAGPVGLRPRSANVAPRAPMAPPPAAYAPMAPPPAAYAMEDGPGPVEAGPEVAPVHLPMVAENAEPEQAVPARPVGGGGWGQLQARVVTCRACGLHRTRTQTVFARGSNSADLMFIGEGPGADEDAQGLPFVGKAGQLLDRMIDAMGFERDDVYVANIVKCRPPDNRKPEPVEMESCIPFLREQIELVDPRAIVALGATATEGLLGLTGITKLRGTWRLYRGRIPVMPTFHPSYLLRNPAAKREVWEDLKKVLERLGRSPRPRG